MIEKARIRTRWKARGRDVSPAEYASAVSAVAWRVSLNAAKNLHQQDFEYRQDKQRLEVIREYLYFFIHVADRMTIDRFDPAGRVEFMTLLSGQCRRHFGENEAEMLGSKNMSGEFVSLLNQRLDQYSETQFEGDEPGYGSYRLLGAQILDIMGSDQTNKWVQDQVLDIDGPEGSRIFSKALKEIHRSTTGENLGR